MGEFLLFNKLSGREIQHLGLFKSLFMCTWRFDYIHLHHFIVNNKKHLYLWIKMM